MALALAAACARAPEPPFVRALTIDGSSYEYRSYRPSVPGRFLFTPRNKETGVSAIAALDADGEVLFDRPFPPDVITTDFKKVEPGRYGYFTTVMGELKEDARRGRVTYHFLDQAFRDIDPRPLPNGDAELDEHDVARLRNGNLIFIFYRESPGDGLIDAELQEWDPKDGKVRAWNSKGSLRPRRGSSRVTDYLHANSVEADSDGGLILSCGAASEVVKISWPEGKVLWRLSSRTWKFPDDPLHGFRFQHTAKRLSNGNILMFDNGGGGRGDVSRAVEYRLDEKARTATMVWERRAPPETPFRPADGSVQRLSNGNTLIGWGEMPNADRGGTRRIAMFTEVDRDGGVVRELTSVGYRNSYRVAFEETP